MSSNGRGQTGNQKSIEHSFGENIAAAGKIFIADDVEQLRTLYSTILRLHGYDVILVASGGEEVVKLAKEGSLKDVEIAIFDYSMGPVNGLEAGIEAIKSNPKIRVIIGSANDEIANEASILGFTFLKKPFAKNDLLGLIASIEQDIRESRHFAGEAAIAQ